ncbi:MAG: hypothetical protein JOZ62_03515 [Acidobacteriaceae bacterium]|nr:hypothetical protein [Acidobacteriaceae bacterium]
MSSVMPSVPGRFFVGDFDRGADGRIVFTGGSVSSSGQIAPFFAWISADGLTSRVISTVPYHPHQVAVAPDGTIWTLGCKMIDHDPWASGLDGNAGIFRHFDAQGKFIASAGPHSQFKGHHQLSRLFSGYLVAKSDRVAWYSGIHSEQGDYVEIRPDTMKRQGYPGLPKLSNSSLVVGFASTDNGGVYVSFEDHAPPPQEVNYRHRRIYMLDRANRQWVLVATPAIGTVVEPHLMGSDGDNLVFMGNDSFGFINLTQ